MADIDPNAVRQAIQSAGQAWRVRELPPDEPPHALGHLPADPQQLQRAIEAGTRSMEARIGVSLTNQAVVGTPAQATAVATATSSLPTEVDWRSRGAVGDVRDQGYCGSCVSFATTGLVGAMAAIEFGQHNLHLSEADQHFCSSHGATCGGWNNATALDQIQSRGVVIDAAFPYMTAFDSPPMGNPADPDHLWLAYCRPEPNREEHCYRITSYAAYTSFFGIDLRKYHLAFNGPLVCGFTVYQDFDVYGGGVYRHVTGAVRGGHAVLVIGYSDSAQAWICRNSWGMGFGGPAHPDGTGAGFFKIGYGDSNIDNEAMYGCSGVTPARQGNWRWCNKCQCLGFAGSATLGPCQAGGNHDHAGSGNYFLVDNSPTYPGQANWRWCNKCQLLAFAGSPSLGPCRAGGSHDHTGSGDYRLPQIGEPGSQANWRWCNKCQCLAFAGSPTLGPCVAGGQHDHAGSGNYSLVQG